MQDTSTPTTTVLTAVPGLVQTKKYWLSFNRAFEEVVDGCIQQHGENWLYLPLRNGGRLPPAGALVRNGRLDRMLRTSSRATDKSLPLELAHECSVVASMHQRASTQSEPMSGQRCRSIPLTGPVPDGAGLRVLHQDYTRGGGGEGPRALSVELWRGENEEDVGNPSTSTLVAGETPPLPALPSMPSSAPFFRARLHTWPM